MIRTTLHLEIPHAFARSPAEWIESAESENFISISFFSQLRSGSNVDDSSLMIEMLVNVLLYEASLFAFVYCHLDI